MTRPLRIDVKDGWYHVSARGIERREIFDGSLDNEHFLEILKECVNRYKIKVHAYCLMDNHYHLLIQTPHANASKAVTRTEKRAASDVKLRSVIDKTEKVLSNVET